MISAIHQQKFSAILYDAETFPRPASSWFDPAYWPDARPALDGRGSAWLIPDQTWREKMICHPDFPPGVETAQVEQTAGQQAGYEVLGQEQGLPVPGAVLKWYRRGGVIAPILGDRYWFSGWESSRAWREWRLLADLWQQGLPVPRPFMAYVERHGRFYRCALMSAYIPQSFPISKLPLERLQDEALWSLVGQLLRQLCEAGVSHPDFNLSNILITEQRCLYCIDFDRAVYRSGQIISPERQIKRLVRSYNKHMHSIQTTEAGVHMLTGDRLEVILRHSF